MHVASNHRDAVANIHIHHIRHAASDQDHVTAVRGQPLTFGDVLRDQAERLARVDSRLDGRGLRVGVDADDVHAEGTLAVGEQSARHDAACGRDDVWVGEGGLHDCRVIRQWEQRVAVHLFAIARGVDLDVAAQHADGVAVDGVVEAVNQAVVPHHHPEAQTHRQQDVDGAALVPPDVAPCEAQVEDHFDVLW